MTWKSGFYLQKTPFSRLPLNGLVNVIPRIFDNFWFGYKKLEVPGSRRLS